MRIKENIKTNIFRGYDIRGIYPTELDEDTFYTIGLGFGTYIQKLGTHEAIVGHDNRLSSNSLYDALIEGITQTGVTVIKIGLVTTPMFYYAQIYLKKYAGMMVTASHNPKDDNGIKFSFDEKGNCKGQEIQDFMKFIQEGNFKYAKGRTTTFNIEPLYIELFKNNLHFGPRKLNVVIDPANGTTSIIAEKLYKLFPMNLTIINKESDGNFPNHHPDPCVESNMQQLKEKVLELKADIGIGFDGDGDRVGVITNKGEFLPTDKYMILIIRNLINKVENKTFLYDVKCSKSLSDEIEKLGGKGICYRTGNSYTKAKVREDNLPFGGELSGHVYFRDKWPGFDSGLYAGLRLLEIMSNNNKNLDEMLDGINKYYSTPEIKIESKDNIKFEVIEKIKKYVENKGYKYLDIDGVRVEFEDSWALIRCSNTGPNITLRFEAKDMKKLKELEKEYIDLVNKYNK